MGNIENYKTKKSFLSEVALLVLILVDAGRTERLNNYQDGDLTLGGMFPIHIKSCSCVSSSTTLDQDSNGCHQVYAKGLFLAEAMIYAVRLVNLRGILPYNITLGYHIRDTCNTLNIAVENALVFVDQRKRTSKHKPDDFQQALSKQEDFSLNRSIPESNIISVIGAGNSEMSQAVTNIFSLFDIPQVAYASSAKVFSDKTRYKTFLRVVPPDTLQAKAIAQLLAHFKWNYVSLISSDDHYAGPLREYLRKDIERLRLCLANDIIFSYNLPSTSVIQNALLRIKETEKSRVILLFVSESSAKVILRVAEALNLTGHVWIASDSWSNAYSLYRRHFSILKGSIGIMFAYTPVKEFVVHLRTRLNKTSEFIKQDPWLKGLSVAVRDEKLTSLINNDMNLSSDLKQYCSDVRSAFTRVDYVMNSVFILAHVIRDFCLRLNIGSNSTKEAKRARCLESIDPQSLLPLLFNRTLKGFSKNLTVDQNGDPPGRYDFFNLQQNLERKMIGSYDSLSKDVLKLNSSLIDFGQGNRNVPKSRCSDTCLPGSYSVKSHSNQAACCWECKTCPPGHISNVSMATACEECNMEHIPNKNRTRCVYVPLRYLTREDPWSIIITVCSLLCFFLAVFFIWVFIRHRHSPVVRASCFEISLVLLLSIAFGFLLPILEIGKPSHHKCKASAFLFAVVFAVILSLTLAKINRTVLILKNRTGSEFFHRKFLLSSPAHFVSVLILSAIQISICIVWFFQNPPKPEVSIISLPNFVRFLRCTSYRNLWFLVSSGFLVLLSFICTALAFRSRNFPENYNHARFISLAMFTFNVVWITFMGAYYGNPQPGKHQLIIHCCAILFSNLCLMLLIYGPKVYVIFFRPELNNARTFREMNLQHLLGGLNGGRSFSLASIGTPGHGNVYLMDGNPNEKAVQTTRVLTRDAQAQTDYQNNQCKRRHKKSSLASRIFGRGSWKKSSDKTSTPHKRVWSESDASKTHDARRIPHSHSSPIPLYTYGQADKRKRTTSRQSKPLLSDFDDCVDFGLDRIEEVKDTDSLATSRSILKSNGNSIPDESSVEFESSVNSLCSQYTQEVVDSRNDSDNDGPTNTDLKYDDVFVMDYPIRYSMV